MILLHTPSLCACLLEHAGLLEHAATSWPGGFSTRECGWMVQALGTVGQPTLRVPFDPTPTIYAPTTTTCRPAPEIHPATNIIFNNNMTLKQTAATPLRESCPHENMAQAAHERWIPTRHTTGPMNECDLQCGQGTSPGWCRTWCRHITLFRSVWTGCHSCNHHRSCRVAHSCTRVSLCRNTINDTEQRMIGC
jgi:hypothetical protein